MQANRARDTRPELAFRRALRDLGLRGYRVDYRPVPGLRRRADVVFTKHRVAVFIDGCYWHGCPEHYAASKTNVDYWSPKIDKNRERDAETNRLLAEEGWTVIRLWEHEDPVVAARGVADVIRAAPS